jgi:hypothetical protein
MIFEAGFIIVSVNLPSLWYFTTGVTPERVLRNVRSLVSLGSGGGSHSSSLKGSKATTVDKTSHLPTAGRSLETSSTRSVLTKNEKLVKFDSYHMTEINAKPDIDSSVERDLHGRYGHDMEVV